ncbi:MAG: D-aminoacyl-tRNA deacylase [Armatimonadota bacterium]|nr:D-aminoacyl-tRNA deacylase [Armatimonadota bacterium]
MRAVVQRVTKAAVYVNGEEVGRIGRGLVVLLAVHREDTDSQARQMAEKVAHLRIFDDAEGKLNLSLLDVGGEVLSISQFTLYGDTSRGRRPSFISAAPPEVAEALYRSFNDHLRKEGIAVSEGQFRARMLVEIHNDGPVTLILET